MMSAPTCATAGDDHCPCRIFSPTGLSSQTSFPVFLSTAMIDGDYGDFASVTDPVSGLDFGGQPAFGIHIPNSGDATKVMYLTPRFAGFQAGVSYTPESGSEAQDVVQDVFLKALERLATLRDPDLFGPWLMSIARHAGVDHRRGAPQLGGPAGAVAVSQPPRDRIVETHPALAHRVHQRSGAEQVGAPAAPGVRQHPGGDLEDGVLLHPHDDHADGVLLVVVGGGVGGGGAFEAALSEPLEAARPDLICLAGFMRILTPAFIDRWRGPW